MENSNQFIFWAFCKILVSFVLSAGLWGLIMFPENPAGLLFIGGIALIIAVISLLPFIVIYWVIEDNREWRKTKDKVYSNATIWIFILPPLVIIGVFVVTLWIVTSTKDIEEALFGHLLPILAINLIPSIFIFNRFIKKAKGNE